MFHLMIKKKMSPSKVLTILYYGLSCDKNCFPRNACHSLANNIITRALLPAMSLKIPAILDLEGITIQTQLETYKTYFEKYSYQKVS